nr:MAG TPA: hypothetical protein [Caudoviricetes sp.]
MIFYRLFYRSSSSSKILRFFSRYSGKRSR